MEYDAVGPQTAKVDQAGKRTEYAYDAVGRLQSVTQFLNGLPLVTQYGYDELGNRISQMDANKHTTTFAYDSMGRRASRTLPAGQSESYAYDANGNLASRTDFNGHTTNYQYDNMNRLQAKIADAFFSTGACAGGACGASQVSFTYDTAGRRQTMTDASGTTTYNYDPVGRLAGKNAPFGKVDWSYDKAGNLTNTGGDQPSEKAVRLSPVYFRDPSGYSCRHSWISVLLIEIENF